MADKDIIFVLTKEEVLECAREMGIHEKAITEANRAPFSIVLSKIIGYNVDTHGQARGTS